MEFFLKITKSLNNGALKLCEDEQEASPCLAIFCIKAH